MGGGIILPPMDPRLEEDLIFERAVLDVVPESARVKAFYTKIVGTKHVNADGSSRIAWIDVCQPFAALDLEAEPDNPVDASAVAVRLASNGKQLGYLDARLAAEVTLDRARCGDRWMALFRHKDRHPDTGRTVGAVIYLVRLAETFYRERESKMKAR